MPETLAQEKHLTFSLDGELFGLSILSVQEIIGAQKVTRVPRLPAWMRGVINLRGKVIPIVDLRAKFGLAAIPDTERTCIIVLQMPGPSGQPLITGVVVDEVSEVLPLSPDQIDPAPDFGQGVEADFIRGLGKTAGGVVMLLDIDRVLDAAEIHWVRQTAAGPDQKEED